MINTECFGQGDRFWVGGCKFSQVGGKKGQIGLLVGGLLTPFEKRCSSNWIMKPQINRGEIKQYVSNHQPENIVEVSDMNMFLRCPF